jgi:hypothetical protein
MRVRNWRPLAGIFLAGQAMAFLATPVLASPQMTGIVLDFKPRKLANGKPAITILRNATSYPVREHEIIYAGDRFFFDKSLAAGARVDVMTGSESVVTVDAAHPELPTSNWPSLQSVAAKLVAAYRWINSSGGEDKAAPRNAISRGDETLAVLPNVRAKLAISDKGNAPLWIGWTGGTAPFVVTLSKEDKKIGELRICDQAAQAGCMREATFENIGDGAEALQLSVVSADGANWTRTLTRVPIAADAPGANASDLGKLATFLHGTGLLDKGHGDLILESARTFIQIAKTYPPARIMLDEIRDAKVP